MVVEAGEAAEKEQTAPEPDDPRKPDSPTELHARSWRYTAKTAFREFKRDQCTDLAAGLTYYAVLAIFPALVAVMSLISLFGDGRQTSDAIMRLLDDLGQPDVAAQLEEPIRQMVETNAAGFTLIIGLVGALWSASGYVGAFGRAMNRIFEVDEGRPFWKLRPLNLALTALLVVLAAVVLTLLVVSGPFARELGDRIGLGDTAVTIWNYGKWPVLLLIVVLIVALLYYATPNIRQPRFRWVSVGAAIAILVWVVASLLFGLYVANFGSYNKTYGAFAGVVIFLLWLWLTNLALLLGAEVDSELERARQLQGGIEAEETLQLPPRDTKVSDKQAAQVAEEVAEGRQLRQRAKAEIDSERQRRLYPAAAPLTRDGAGPDGSGGPSTGRTVAEVAGVGLLTAIVGALAALLGVDDER